MSAAATDASGCVLVPIERLRELETLEAELPAIVAKAKEEANAERFTKLRERDKADPESHRKRNAEWKEKHREELNAKRREMYKLKKAELAAKTPGSGDAAASRS